MSTPIPAPVSLAPIRTRLDAVESGKLSAALPISLIDAAPSTDHVIDIDHNGAGDAQAYAINIYNRPDSPSAPTAGTGAKTAFVVHQYSDAGPAAQIDNTRSQPLLRLRNAHNDTNSAGTFGAGAFLDFWGYSTNAVYPASPIKLGELNSFLGFYSYDNSRPWQFTSATSADSLRVAKGTEGGRALLVSNGSTGEGVKVDQTGAGNGISINQTGAAVALQITAGSGAAGFWPLKIDGQNYGPKITTTTNSGNSLIVQKDGTGAGDVVLVTNKGTGKTVSWNNATREVASLDKDGMPRFGTGNTAAPPTASATVRGKLWMQEGGAGVADKLYVCMKTAADAYSWVQIATG